MTINVVTPLISVEEVARSDMVIDKWEFRPGEVRIYEESRRISSDAFGRTFYIKKCLGRVEVPGEPGRALMVRHETYTENYAGMEKNRIRTPIKGDYYLSMREYDTISTREDGVYTLWTSVWGPNFENENPEDTLHDPPGKWNEPPMKVCHTTGYEKKQGDYSLNVHSKVIGQYVVRIDEAIFDCLLKRTHSFWSKGGQKEIDRIAERYVTNGLVDILIREYDNPTKKRKWMFESVKDWEKNPSVECCGEMHYLTSEFYFASIGALNVRI